MQFTVYANSRPAERAARLRTLTFPDILSDPMVRLVMKADGVNPDMLKKELGDIASALPTQPEPAIGACPAQVC